jgi:hypothetical protein
MGWCPLPWPRRAASGAMLEVAAGGGYRVSPCALRRRLRLCGPIHTTAIARSRPRLAPGTSLCAVWTFLSDLSYELGAAVLPPGVESIRRRRLITPTSATPSATGSNEIHTVGSSVLPPPPLPISLASVPTLASRSGRPARSIPNILPKQASIRFCGWSSHPAARSYREPETPVR